MSSTPSTLRIVAMMMAIAAAIPATAQTPAMHEAAPRLAAALLAPAVLLSGPLHSVGEPVAIENYMGRFEMQTPFGRFNLASVEMLAIRVSELAAIEALEQVNRSEAFQQALGRSALAPVQLVGNAITDPGGTVENVASGVGTVLGRIGRLAATGAHAVGDTASNIVRSQPGTQSAAGQDEPVPPSFTGDPFGFNRARREWAKSLNIDPYTTNPVLRTRLDSAARATFAGNFMVGATIGLVAAPLQYATGFDGVVRDSVWNVPVIDLVAQNEAKLRGMGIEGRLVRDFFRNRWFTPTLQTALVAALEKLPQVRGRYTVIRAATATRGEARARALVGAVSMLSRHHALAPLSAIRMSGIVAIGSTAGGELVVATDLDYVWWNAESQEFAERADLAAKRRTLLVSGLASARAVEELGRAHWDVRTALRPYSTY
jgi:hypothetical protein